MKRVGLFLAMILMLSMVGFVSAHSITVDGNPTDWKAETSTQSTNTWQLYSDVGEGVWKDATGDERTDFANPDKRVDITEFRVTADDQYIYFLIKFNDLDVVGQDGAPGIMITLDTNPGFGEPSFGYNSETNVNSDARWEYQLLLDLANGAVQDGTPVYGDGTLVWNGGSPLDLVDMDYSVDLSSSNDMFVASTTNDLVEVRILKSELGNPSMIRVELAVVRVNPNGDAWDISEVSDVLDAMTTTGPNTWDEVSDGVVDYYVDIDISQVPFFSDLAVALVLVVGAILFFRRH